MRATVFLHNNFVVVRVNVPIDNSEIGERPLLQNGDATAWLKESK